MIVPERIRMSAAACGPRSPAPVLQIACTVHFSEEARLAIVAALPDAFGMWRDRGVAGRA